MEFWNRNKKGYGWNNPVRRDKQGNQVPKEDVRYINLDFTKGTEPLPNELTEYGSYAVEWFIRDTTGAERKVFPIIDDYHKSIVFKVMGKENEYHDPEPTWQPPKTATTLHTEAKWEYKRNEIPTEIDEDVPFL